MTARRFVLLLLSLALVAGCRSTPTPPTLPTPPTPVPSTPVAFDPADLQSVAVDDRGMVAAVQPIAAAAGARALADGGTAVDAAVATALTLGVVDTPNSGIGGGCFMLIRTPAGEVVALDGRETAPAAATRDLFVRDGKAVAELSQTGALASGVPGSLAVYDAAIRKYGKKTLASHLRHAAAIAADGFPLDATYARRLAGLAPTLRRFPASAAALLKPDGSPYGEGEILRQPDLADTYAEIADKGIGYFYGGPFAAATERWMKANGGLLTAADFAGYEMRVREPVVSTYRGLTVYGFPPPSSGGVHVAQILNIIEDFDVAGLQRRGTADRVHVVAEAEKLAFVDRAYWLGDPDFADVPTAGLVSQDYADTLAGRIDPQRAIAVPTHGTPPGANPESDLSNPKSQVSNLKSEIPDSAPRPTATIRFSPDGHTTHIAVADAAGYWVGITATVNTGFGSKVVVPGTGVVLNNQMDDFSAQPGVPNHFGLVGSEANAVGPGKRPLSSMSPTLVTTADGTPVLAIGAAGGPRIITAVVEAVSNVVDLGTSVADAVAAPRFHHQWSPDVLYVEDTMPAEVIEALRAMGHTVEVGGPAGTANAVGRVGVDPAAPFVGVSDPRVDGAAVGPTTRRAAPRPARR